MLKSSSRVIFAQLPEAEYNYVFKEVNKRKMKLKSWLTELIKEARQRAEESKK